MTERRIHRRPRVLVGLAAGAAMVAASMVASGGGGPSASAGDDDDDDGGGSCGVDYTLTVLHNNDGESAVLERGTDDEEAGVARFATLVDQAKQEAVGSGGSSDDDDDDDDDDDGGGSNDRGVVFVTSGDNFLASPEFAASVNDGTFYDARAIELLCYDA